MPEYIESTLSQILAQKFVEWCTEKGHNLLVKDLWADATNPEQKDTSFCPVGSRGHEGHVHVIDSSCMAYRGQSSRQVLLYPYMYHESQVPIQQRDLRLKGVHFAARNVVLDFGSAWAQVSGLSCEWLSNTNLIP